MHDLDLAVVGPDRFGECNLVEEQCTRQAQGAAQMVGPRENGDVVTQRINNIVSRVQRGCSNRSRPFNSLPPRDSHELGRIRDPSLDRGKKQEQIDGIDLADVFGGSRPTPA